MTLRERIAEAVDDEEWQGLRESLKGKTTREKVEALHLYFESVAHQAVDPHTPPDYDCDVCVQLDNYVKALCRGGQLYKGESLVSMIRCGWDPDIKS